MFHWNRSSKRKRFNAGLGLAIAGVFSMSVPYLNGGPPKSNTGPESQNSKVQIRFPQSSGKAQTQQAQTQQGRETKPTPPPTKLTADANRTSNVSERELLQNNKPITVATEEEKNQKIAVDWKNPWAVFFITGRQYGYIEPCGCTGLENQKGGLNRRDTLLTSIRSRGWNVVPLDAGNQVRRPGPQSEIKFGWSSKAFGAMGYQATTYGEADLQLAINSLLLPLIDDDAKPSKLFVSANVSVEPEYDTQFKIITIKNKKIGITGVLGDENARKVDNKEVNISPAIPSLKKVAAKMRQEKCDFQVLLCHASLDESTEIIKAVPEFSLAITAGGYGEPTYRPEVVPGTNCQMVQVGEKGMYAGIFGLFDDPKQPFKYQRIALSSQFDDSPRMMELFGKYQDEVKAGLTIRPVTHPSTREFSGSQKCGECHTNAFEIWEKTPHAHATDSIVSPPNRSIPRHFDPECMSCHVTGWNLRLLVPYVTGYDSLETTPHLLGNGCENCHGPGAKHVAAEEGSLDADKELISKLRAEMRLPMERAQDKCMECHDADNSPEFHKENAFLEYWEKIKHIGKD